MMHYIEAPDRTTEVVGKSVFMAGGITDCPNWQGDYVKLMSTFGIEPNRDFTLLNPRRRNFNVRDPEAGPEQVRWEAAMLGLADAVSFWFPCETLCPITLYELGAWSMTDKPIFVGCHPDYKRMFDVMAQTALRRPEVDVVESLEGLTWAVRDWLFVSH